MPKKNSPQGFLEKSLASLVGKRLNELNKQRQQIETRLEELERLNVSQAEIDTIVTEAMKFVSGLDFALHQGLPQEKLVALRQCIERIFIDKPAETIKLRIRVVPVGNLQVTEEYCISVHGVPSFNCSA